MWLSEYVVVNGMEVEVRRLKFESLPNAKKDLLFQLSHTISLSLSPNRLNVQSCPPTPYPHISSPCLSFFRDSCLFESKSLKSRPSSCHVSVSKTYHRLLLENTFSFVFFSFNSFQNLPLAADPPPSPRLVIYSQPPSHCKTTQQQQPLCNIV